MALIVPTPLILSQIRMISLSNLLVSHNKIHINVYVDRINRTPMINNFLMTTQMQTPN